tara:strand:+ start:235 stop:423 length:189 start_codon:yes stop_codon:yes gene_type:complete
MTNEEINDSECTEEESQGIDIYEEIRKEIQRYIDSEDEEQAKDLYESIWDKNYYESQSEGKE